MGHRFLTFLGAIAFACTAVFISQTPVAGQQTGAAASSTAQTRTWKPARTPWGDPDLAGIYSNSDESGIPFERPAQFEGRRLEDVTAKELEELRVARRNATAANSVAEDRPVDREVFWENLNAVNSRAWLVVDPTDGKIPPTTPEARARAAARAEARKKSGRGPADAPEDRSLYDRCISRGLPGSMMPAIYGSSYEIVQGPNFVAIVYEMVHETRVIPLDGQPHVAKNIRSYMGDARGRWDGDTLVVETTNFKDQIAYRNANGETLRLVERFTATGPSTIEWSVTVDDPATWTKPWTFAMNLSKKDTTQRPFEYACHEGNYGLRNILSAARAEEQAARTAKPGSNGK
ncbi:MAG TPA: hypothetical protein VFS23_14870 [Vicinamibacterales bacterium]|nr:hypothetical protein [Vicinamibacterales bacterium]